MNSKTLRNVFTALTLLSCTGEVTYQLLSPTSTLSQTQTVVVNGFYTSEKEAFFKDPAVIAILKNNGITLNLMRQTSGALADKKDLNQTDFVFVPGDYAFEKIKAHNAIQGSALTWYSPCVLLSWQNVVDTLAIKNNQVDVQSLFQYTLTNTPWSDLKGAYDKPNTIAITISNPTSSNASKQFLSLAATSLKDEQRVVQLTKAIGNMPESSNNLTELYTIKKTPLVWVDESNYFTQVFQNQSPTMRVIYPSPTIMTNHYTIYFSDKGQKLAQLLQTNAELQRIAMSTYGFRIKDEDEQPLLDVAKTKNVTIPKTSELTTVPVVDTTTLDRLIQSVTQ